MRGRLGWNQMRTTFTARRSGRLFRSMPREARLFVVGAYPSARFHQIKGVNDVPVGDNLGPFEAERWFDGARVRVQPSAAELENHFLGPDGTHQSGLLDYGPREGVPVQRWTPEEV